jgi:hypothetical protein
MRDTGYDIGSTNWPGLAKVIEETAELQQVLAKLIATGGQPDYFDGTDLNDSLHCELADTLAAIWFFFHTNPQLDVEFIHGRANRKLHGFRRWHEESDK